MHTSELLTQAEQERLDALKEHLKVFDEYVADRTVSEVAVNSTGEVYLKRGHGWDLELAPKITSEQMEIIGSALSNFVSKPFDRENTSLSAHFPTGERVEMTRAPQAPEGVIYLNLRKHSGAAFPHDELVAQNYYKYARHSYSISLTKERRDELYELISDEERELWELIHIKKDFPEFMRKSVVFYQNIVTSGATGSGKTAYLRSLIELIDPQERLVTVEDTHEMPLPNHPNHNHLFYKKNETVKEGATAKEVLHGVMRKTPGRVLLTELRGDEALFYLSGVLSSGHPGGLTSAHGNSERDVFFRLALLIISSDAGKSLDMDTILKLLYMTINVVVQLKFDKEKGRHITGIYYDPMQRLHMLG